MKSLCLLLLAVVPIFASAGQITLHLASKHSHERAGSHSYNERNYGIGFGFTAFDYCPKAGVGFYDNSYGSRSIYATCRYTLVNRPISAEAFIGGVNGYDAVVDSGVLPIAGIRITTNTNPAPELVLMPTRKGAVALASYTYRY